MCGIRNLGFSKSVEPGKVCCACALERSDCLVQKLGFDDSFKCFSYQYLPTLVLSLGVVKKRPLMVGSPICDGFYA